MKNVDVAIKISCVLLEESQKKALGPHQLAKTLDISPSTIWGVRAKNHAISLTSFLCMFKLLGKQEAFDLISGLIDDIRLDDSNLSTKIKKKIDKRLNLKKRVRGTKKNDPFIESSLNEYSETPRIHLSPSPNLSTHKTTGSHQI